MKLHPPIINIPDNEPYKNDLFQRNKFADTLTNILSSTEDPIVMSIHAQWGDGKTTFADMWLKSLAMDGKKSIYFDAYRSDYCNDPFVAFCSEIISLAKDRFSEDDNIQGLTADFMDKAKRVGGKLLNMGVKVGLKMASLGFLDGSEPKELMDAASNRCSISVDMAEAFDEYTNLKKDIQAFGDKLGDLGKAVRSSQNFPLLIVVDELDRCRPDYALLLIERIKHIFDARNVVFVLLLNMDQNGEICKYRIWIRNRC